MFFFFFFCFFFALFCMFFLFFVFFVFFSFESRPLFRNGFSVQESTFPADIWCLYNVASTSMQRHDVASTLIRRCLNVACPLGISFLANNDGKTIQNNLPGVSFNGFTIPRRYTTLKQHQINVNSTPRRWIMMLNQRWFDGVSTLYVRRDGTKPAYCYKHDENTPIQIYRKFHL